MTFTTLLLQRHPTNFLNILHRKILKNNKNKASYSINWHMCIWPKIQIITNSKQLCNFLVIRNIHQLKLKICGNTTFQRHWHLKVEKTIWIIKSRWFLFLLSWCVVVEGVELFVQLNYMRVLAFAGFGNMGFQL